MRIRTRMLILFCATIAMLVISLSTFLIYRSTSERLRDLRLSTMALSKEIFRLRYLSDELLTSAKFTTVYDIWAKSKVNMDDLINSFFVNPVLIENMNDGTNKKQVDVLRNVWTLAKNKVNDIAERGRIVPAERACQHIVQFLHRYFS